MGRIAVIVNPASGAGRAEAFAEEARRFLEGRGARASVFRTAARGDAEAEARRVSGEAAAVLCIGGDGTVGEAANGLIGSDTPLAVLPTGTANMLAGEFGIPRDPRKAAETALDGARAVLDAGRWNSRVFLCLAGVGFDAEVARRYASSRRSLGGYPGYVVPFFGALAEFSDPELEVEVDGRRLLRTCAWALASNIKRYGGPLRFTGAADPGDGLLEFAGTTRRGLFANVRYFAESALRRFEGAPGTVSARGARISVRPRSGRAPVQLDGDFAGTCGPGDPAVFEVLPRAFTLLVPRPA
jgi:diacylglycerol kinase family enzyme